MSDAQINTRFGFIITRCVKTAPTNKYWNQCIKLIRRHYPRTRIIIIDDNSNYDFVKADHDYLHCTTVQSEYPGRGELLPFIYYLRNRWFENAVIIHDSVFIHKRIPFEQMNEKIVPLWHHEYDGENRYNLIRIANRLSDRTISTIVHRDTLEDKHVEFNIGGKGTPAPYNLCFGVQCYINYDFLLFIQGKYNITNLVHAVHNRTDRCGLERIFGLIFSVEGSNYIKNKKSLFGDIMKHYKAFTYTYDDYIKDFYAGTARGPFVKVWTGR